MRSIAASQAARVAGLAASHCGVRQKPKRGGARGLCRGGQVAAAEHAAQQRGSGNIGSEHAHGVERPGGGLDAGRADPAVSRLIADNPAERRRANDGASGLRADGQRHFAGSDSRRRAAGRAARGVRPVVRVARLAGIEESELGGHRLAHHQPARSPDQRDRRRVRSRRMPRIDRRAICRGHVVGIEQILDPHGQAVQRPPRRRARQAAGPLSARFVDHNASRPGSRLRGLRYAPGNARPTPYRIVRRSRYDRGPWWRTKPDRRRWSLGFSVGRIHPRVIRQRGAGVTRPMADPRPSRPAAAGASRCGVSRLARYKRRLMFRRLDRVWITPPSRPMRPSSAFVADPGRRPAA